ncbi:hypothetical protein NC651_030699 [Populus alba x Populus x berolinensis]|nr:hypothetical protein NC651_030699 [Populus alba x Populus x berolinensis]
MKKGMQRGSLMRYLELGFPNWRSQILIPITMLDSVFSAHSMEEAEYLCDRVGFYEVSIADEFMKLRLQEPGSLFMLGGCLCYHLGRCLHQGHKLSRAIPHALNWQKLPLILVFFHF